MKGSLALALLLVLSGCLRPAPLQTTSFDPFESFSLEGANVTRLSNGDLEILFEGRLSGPSQSFVFPIPNSTTYVEGVLKVPSTVAPILVLRDNATGRPLCNPTYASSFLQNSLGEIRCSGLAALPTSGTWQAIVQAPRGTPFSLTLTLSRAPLDGSASRIRLEALSKPTWGIEETQIFKVPMSDGARLHVEVTLPSGPGPWPTILVSSPYNNDPRSRGIRPMDSLILDMVPRGYAVVVADVRGFGNSEGCVEVWGPREQKDQAELVEWVASQPWSNGKVVFYGQSYVGTTPVEAAVQAPKHLSGIAIVAPVINAWDDWHFGGVPNGENIGSPVAYQQLGTEATEEDPLTSAILFANGFCDPTLLARANDPRSVYDDFYKERNFSARASEVRVPVFYMQGFWDVNVKGTMITRWFNSLSVPKKGLFGPWVHEHAARADEELLLHAFFDEVLKGIPTGFFEGPSMEVLTPQGLLRTGDTWPTPPQGFAKFHLREGALDSSPGSGSPLYLAEPTPAGTLPAQGEIPKVLRYTSPPLETPLYVSGHPTLLLRVRVLGGENSYVSARLFDLSPEGKERLVTFGWVSLAHRKGWETYDPVPPGQPVEASITFLPVDDLLLSGHRLRLEISSTNLSSWEMGGGATEPGVVLVEESQALLTLPLLPPESLREAPRSAR